MAKFDLGDSLANILGSVSPSDTEEQIEYISLQYLVSDERNFYSMDGVEELAANIELIGLQQPLRVLKGDNGFYVIVSGHRRAAALRLLAEDAPEKWDRVPCIVEKPGGSPELEELRLIMANADTRRMSSADLAKQAERVEMLLYQLKEQGVINVTGRMRDRVAEACQVSATKLAELKVIREKLIPELQELWEENKLNHSKAYTLAKASQDVQRRIATLVKPKLLVGCAEWSVGNWIETVTKIERRKCDHCGMEAGRKTCSIVEPRLKAAFAKPEYYSPCKEKCCCDCYNLRDCVFAVCAYAVPLQQQKHEEAEKQEKKRKEEKARYDAERKEREEIEKADGMASWRRIAAAQKTSGASTKSILRFVQDYDNENQVDEEEIEEAEKKMRGEGFDIPFYNQAVQLDPFAFDVYESLTMLADLMKCSTDYLLGRAEEPAPWKGAWISVDDRYPEEGDYCLVCTASRVVLPAVYFRASFMDFTEKSVGNVRIPRVEHWMPLPKAPGKYKYMGQETLDSLTNRG